MPNAAMPDIDDETGLIREYSAPITGIFPATRINNHPVPPIKLPPIRMANGKILINQLPNFVQVGEKIGIDANNDLSQPIKYHKHVVNEAMDAGHRHFSAMHWLYPNLFPYVDSHNEKGFAYNTKLFDAAKATLQRKKDSNGGHTSWSARCAKVNYWIGSILFIIVFSWEACLWARAGESENAMEAITRIINRFMSMVFKYKYQLINI